MMKLYSNCPVGGTGRPSPSPTGYLHTFGSIVSTDMGDTNNCLCRSISREREGKADCSRNFPIRTWPFSRQIWHLYVNHWEHT